MLSSVGIIYPNQWDNCKHGFDREYEQLHSNYVPPLYGTNAITSTTFDHWTLSNIASYKNGSFINRSHSDQFANFKRIHNDEDDGLVFGCPEEYYDTKQYDWVWRWADDTDYWWVFFHIFVTVITFTSLLRIKMCHFKGEEKKSKTSTQRNYVKSCEEFQLSPNNIFKQINVQINLLFLLERSFHFSEKYWQKNKSECETIKNIKLFIKVWIFDNPSNENESEMKKNLVDIESKRLLGSSA